MVFNDASCVTWRRERSHQLATTTNSITLTDWLHGRPPSLIINNQRILRYIRPHTHRRARSAITRQPGSDEVCSITDSSIRFLVEFRWYLVIVALIRNTDPTWLRWCSGSDTRFVVDDSTKQLTKCLIAYCCMWYRSNCGRYSSVDRPDWPSPH